MNIIPAKRSHSLPVRLSYLNVHPLEVVSRQRDPQFQIGENYSYLFSLTPSASRCIKASFYIIKNKLYCLTTKGFRRQILMKLFYEYMVFFFNLPPTSSHLYPLQVENCDSNSRLVVNEDDTFKFRLERVKYKQFQIWM